MALLKHAMFLAFLVKAWQQGVRDGGKKRVKFKKKKVRKK